MIKKETLLFFFIIALAVIFAGCKNKSAIPVETVEPEPPAPVQTWDDPDTSSFSEVDLEAELAEKIKENLQVVYFELDKSDLSAESMQKIRIAADFLKSQPQIRVRLDGHADERGTVEYNFALSEKRAYAVRDVLTRYGIDDRRMETTSFGKEKPANPYCNGEEACHSLNRRVEYTIIKK
ncbi:MAG: OmpA family protein [Chitinispirillales bacterium]|nr:OmpA family protein [Chitinispirillales bacterium]